MSPPEIVIAAVACLALIAGWWNATATLLALEWMAGEAIWLMSGDNLPLGIYWLLDITVIAFIYARTPLPIESYRTARKQTASFWHELKLSDRGVIIVYGLMWIAYIAPVDDFSRWWALYALAMAQFGIALGGAWFRRGARRSKTKPSANDENMMLAWGGGGG